MVQDAPELASALRGVGACPNAGYEQCQGVASGLAPTLAMSGAGARRRGFIQCGLPPCQPIPGRLMPGPQRVWLFHSLRVFIKPMRWSFISMHTSKSLVANSLSSVRSSCSV